MLQVRIIETNSHVSYIDLTASMLFDFLLLRTGKTLYGVNGSDAVSRT